MRKSIALCLIICGLLIEPWPCFATSVLLTGAGSPLPPATSTTLSLDGTAHGETGSGISITATLSTTKTNDIIIAVAAQNGCGELPVISDSPGGLTWHQRAT